MMIYLGIAIGIICLVEWLYICNLFKKISLMGERIRRIEGTIVYPSVCYSTEDPAPGHIPIWGLGDIWINYESLRCFMLVSEEKRYWKVIGTKGYTQADGKKIKECDTKGWDLKVFKGEKK
jgi:hypothetical protein